MSDFMQRAQEALTNEGNRWSPDPGGQLAGTLVRIRHIEGQWGDFRVAVIRPMEGGTPVEVAEKKVLKEAMDEMEQHGPGCQVALKYLGRRQNKSGTGQQYDSYTSYVEPAPATAPVDKAAAVEPERAYQEDNANRERMQRQHDALNTPTQPAPAAVDPTPEQATDAATMTAQAKAALANSDQDTLARIGARARELGFVWNKTTQRYDDVPVADAVL